MSWVHAAPLGFFPITHMRLSPQYWPVWQAGSGVPARTPSQVPGFGPLQVEHMPVQALTQQTPSTQKPEPHSLPAPQAAPLGLRPVWQVPAASQYCPLMLHGVVEPVSCEPAGTFTHAPRLPGTLQAWQAVVQVLLQHLPSTQ
jgi:hypothetical protein